MRKKIKIILLTILLFCGNKLICNDLLSKADSLYQMKKFTQALNVYNELILDNKTTQSMLLKIAFIHEGLGNYEKALYFLSKYYKITNNTKVLIKIEELAKKHNLDGYERKDKELFNNFLFKNKNYFILSFCILILLSMFIIYKERKMNIKSFSAISIQLFSCFMIFLLVNNYFITKTAIINSDNTLIMSGPSGGSSLIEILNKGNKIKIIENEDVWYRINYNDNEAYILKMKVSII